jgi:PKD repeat protein
VNQKPVPDFSYNNNCSGYPSYFTDISTVQGGYPTAWHWYFGLANDTSYLQNPTYAYANGGTYDVFLQVTSNNGCTASLTKPVVILPTPLANAGTDKTIPYGTNTSLQGGATGGSGNYSYHWEPAGQLVNPNVNNPVTVNLSNSTDYSLTVTDAGNACQQTDVATVIITGGPLSVQVLAEPAALCKGSLSNINLQPGGGSGNYTYSWSSSPSGFSSSLEDITVQPDVTTTYTVAVNDGFSNVNKTVTVTVYDNPVVDAGADKTIPFGTSTVMNGSGSSATPPLTYSWNPSNLVTAPAQYNTPTVILTSTTNYTLTLTDGHGCSSSNQTLITISGGALMVLPQAQKTPICIGESTTLNPMSEGGSGNYTYTWSTAAGFLSYATVPEVAPLQTTTYHLDISDGFTTSSGNVMVTVFPLPVINLIPSGAHVIGTDTIQACVFDTVTIAATGPNLKYLWSNGAITPSIQSTTTGIAFDMLSYSVEVTNTLTNCSNSAALTIIYTYDDCSYGIPQVNDNLPVLVYPNPGNGVFTCQIQSDYKALSVDVLNSQGATVLQKQVVLQSESLQRFPVDIATLPSGVYFLKLYNDSFLRIVKIVKY